MSTFEQLWGILPHPEGSVLRWFAKKGDRREGEFAESAGALQRATKIFDGWDFYIQLNPTNERCGTRVTAKDVTHWCWFLIDVDPVETVFDAKAAVEEAVLWTGEWAGYNLTPAIVNSGRGYQAWVRLQCMTLGPQDEDVSTSPRWRARQTMRYWLKKLDRHLGTVHGCRVDASCSDLPRVMRCPGTVNHKTGRLAVLEQPGVLHPGLDARLTTAVPPEEFKIVARTSLPEGTPWQIVYPRLTNAARRYLDNGQTEPGRHAAAMACAYSLRDAGLHRTEAVKALIQGNDRSDPPMSDTDLDRILSSAYGVEKGTL